MEWEHACVFNDYPAVSAGLPTSFVTRVGAGGHPGATRKDRAYDRGPHHKTPGVTPPCNGVLRAKN